MCLRCFVFFLFLTSLNNSSIGQNLSGLLIPNPLAIAITVGQWLVKDNQKVYYVRIESTAPTIGEARSEGFKLAVGQALGMLIVSETEIKNQTLIRNEVIQYSSGYIHDFKILNESSVGNMTRLVMDVWVTESKIADRLLNISKAEATIDGEKSSIQYQSNLNQLISGDRLLELVLNDFPHKSFDIKVGKSIVSMPERNIKIQVPISISWNKNYISSLIEILEKTRQGNTANTYRNSRWVSVVRYKNKSDWFMSIAAFSDKTKLNLLESYLIKSNPMIKLTIKDVNNNSILHSCFQYDGLSGSYLGEPNFFIYPRDPYSGKIIGQFFSLGGEFPENMNAKTADFSIYGDFKDDLLISINLPEYYAKNNLEKMEKTEVSIVQNKNCN